MVAKLMEKLGITEAEALEIIDADKRIDKGEKLFELTAEQEQASKQARQADSKPREKKVTKERKVDNDKREIIQAIDDALCDLVDNVEVVNPEREIVFHFNERKYKIVLSAPRKQGRFFLCILPGCRNFGSIFVHFAILTTCGRCGIMAGR